jgi:hypothetical protein
MEIVTQPQDAINELIPKINPKALAEAIADPTVLGEHIVVDLFLQLHNLRESATLPNFTHANRLKYAMSCIWRMKVLIPEFMHRAADIRWSHGGWGRIHFMALLTISLVGLLRALPKLLKLYTGRLQGDPLVRHRVSASVLIDSLPRAGVEADGQFVGQTPARFTVRAGSLQVLCGD